MELTRKPVSIRTLLEPLRVMVLSASLTNALRSVAGRSSSKVA